MTSREIEAKKDKNPPGFTWGLLFQLVTTCVEKFGWPGTVLVGLLGFVHWNATSEQKQRIIELYVLGKGIEAVWPICAMSLLFVLILWAQRCFHGKDSRKRDERIRELESENLRLKGRMSKKALLGAKKG